MKRDLAVPQHDRAKSRWRWRGTPQRRQLPGCFKTRAACIRRGTCRFSGRGNCCDRESPKPANSPRWPIQTSLAGTRNEFDRRSGSSTPSCGSKCLTRFRQRHRLELTDRPELADGDRQPRGRVHRLRGWPRKTCTSCPPHFLVFAAFERTLNCDPPFTHELLDFFLCFLSVVRD